MLNFDDPELEYDDDDLHPGDDDEVEGVDFIDNARFRRDR
jgi:hypothetical protein